MLKIRRSSDCLIFNIGIPIPGKDGLYIETPPGSCLVRHPMRVNSENYAHDTILFCSDYIPLNDVHMLHNNFTAIWTITFPLGGQYHGCWFSGLLHPRPSAAVALTEWCMWCLFYYIIITWLDCSSESAANKTWHWSRESISISLRCCCQKTKPCDCIHQGGVVDIDLLWQNTSRDHFVYSPSQWVMMFHCNIISHWLGTYAKWSLYKLANSRSGVENINELGQILKAGLKSTPQLLNLVV